LAAASREPQGRNLLVEESHVISAAWYVQKWGKYSIDLILNAGIGVYEGTLKKVLNAVTQEPGIHRSKIMRHHHLSKREMDDIVGTLEDRGHIQIQREGKLQRLWAM
jgi:hypothetical protein